MIELPESEKRTFDCPRCHKPILSRKGQCVFCTQKFDESTLFSCPRCGALVAQSDEKCPGCQAPLSDSGIGPGTMTEKEVDIVLSELETLSKSIAEKVESGMKEMEPEERERLEVLVGKMLELQISGADELGIRGSRATSEEEQESERPKIVRVQKSGRVNGLKTPRREHVNGMINGTGARARRERDFTSWQNRKIVGKLQVWQMLSIIIVAAVIIASLAAVVYTGADREAFIVDGDFSDWAPVPSYPFSAVLPEIDAPVLEAKIGQSGDQVFLYLRTDGGLFSGSEPSSLYAFVDSDSDPATGYGVGRGFGADSFNLLVGWNGIVRGSGYYVYTDTTDRSNWSAWSSRGSTAYWHESPEIEMKLISGQSQETAPLVKLVSREGATEKTSPAISTSGSVIAVQKSLVGGDSILSPGYPVMNLSISAMGIEDAVNIEPFLVDKHGDNLSVGTIDLIPNSRVMKELSPDLAAYAEGDFFSFGLSVDIAAGHAIQVLGDPASGYYISPPDGIEIDGAFGDWATIKSLDNDEVALSNPDIDIDAVGASADQALYYFYAGVKGTALGGANVPEERSKNIPSEPSGDIVRLRKTGEDLLQAFIDVDPPENSGKEIQAGDHIIHADFLIEVYGRNGVPTSTSILVYEWSSDMWQESGDLEEIAVAAGEIELSVDKQQLGNLSSSEIVFFATDWKANSDSSLIGPAMVDPWVMLESGQDYRSPDGVSWALGDNITLQSSDRVVDITLSPSKDYVFAVTNSGRAYRWIVGSSSQWSSVLTNQITGVTDVVAIAMCNYDDGFVLTSDGNLYRGTGLTPLFPPPKDWVLVSQISGGYTDFIDLVWRAGSDTGTAELYALRSTSDTNLLLTTNGGSSWSSAGVSTGSSDQQRQMAVIPGDPCQIFVLSDSGEIRYSDDSAASWSAKGDLPEPGTGNESMYIGIAIDSLSDIWIITDTGFCFKSSDGGDTFSFTGRPIDAEVTGIVAPIPEFRDLIVPVMAVLSLVPILIRVRKLREKGRGKEKD